MIFPSPLVPSYALVERYGHSMQDLEEALEWFFFSFLLFHDLARNGRKKANLNSSFRWCFVTDTFVRSFRSPSEIESAFLRLFGQTAG